MTENQEVASQGGNRMTTSTSNPLGWKVGQKVSYVELRSHAKSRTYEATITKVGRKYGEVVYRYENKYSEDGWMNSHPAKFDLASGYSSDGPTPYFRVATPEVLSNESRIKTARAAMEAGGLKWVNYGRCPLTADQMERIAAILNETKEEA